MSAPDENCRSTYRAGTAGLSQISPCQYWERLGPSNPIQNMNEWQELESGDGGLNGRVWVLVETLTSTELLEDLLHPARARLGPFGCLQAVVDRVHVLAVERPEERFGLGKGR